MGLSASQARFLGITARKSNIEYEGQQVNQQRTALTEEVNALYNKLLSLKLPIAPETTDFYESNYKFEVSDTSGFDGKYTIKSYFPNDDEKTYTLNLIRAYNKTVAVGEVFEDATVTKEKEKIQNEDGTTSLGDNDVLYLNTKTGSFRLYENAQNSESIAKLVNDTYGKDPETGKYPIDTKTDLPLYYYKDADGQTHYVPATQVQEGAGPHDIHSYISTSKEFKENLQITDAELSFDENNRIDRIIKATDPTTGKTIASNAEVDASRDYDNEGYERALKDYTMSKDEYDKKVADLNAQTESLQQEDKILELRLRQIDTEQNELQTELDAVKAVLDKNIEKTFNTFS